jgi:hypothetical protein
VGVQPQKKATAVFRLLFHEKMHTDSMWWFVSAPTIVRLNQECDCVRVPWQQDLSFCLSVQTASGAHPTSHLMVPGFLPREQSGRCVKQVASLLTIPRLRLAGATSSLPHNCLIGYQEQLNVYSEVQFHH